MAVNLKLLRKVRKLIAEEPKRLNMVTWGRFYPDVKTETLPACGTVACLAGWTVLASESKKERAKLFTEQTSCGFRYRPDENSIPGRAAELLGIPRNDCPFWQMHWKAENVLAWIDEQIAKAK